MTVSTQFPTYPRMNNQSLILNLPSEITTDILLRLPTKTITTCKCVCKKWLKIISTPKFSKSHLLKPTHGLIVYLTQGGETLCRIVEFEDFLALKPHDLHYKPLMNFDPNILTDFSPKPNNIMMLCSVNGLLCLRDYSTELDTLLICNPTMREFITLPGLEGNVEYPNIVTYGIGITASSFHYKVVRISHDTLAGSETDLRLSGLKIECMVYTLGTGSWRSVEPNVVYEYSLGPRSGSFLNGSLHWLAGDENGSQLISCFDLEMELFKPFASPPFETSFPYNGTLLTLLGECLCVCNYGSDEEIVIWVMTDYGIEGSWTKKFVICKWEDLWGISYESVTPLQVFKNGDILMLWENTCLFYHCKESETNPKIDFFEMDRYGCIDALLHSPSFLSLRSFGPENVSSF